MGRIYRAWSLWARRCLATSIAALLLSGAPLHAADIAVPGPAYYPKAFPPPAIYDWTGIYVGFHVGGGILTDTVSQSAITAASNNLAASGSLRPAGVIGGLQGGANYEFAPWVVGVEGSWTDSAISGSALISCPTCGVAKLSTPQERFTSNAQWFAALTGRAGYAANDWLFYAKAGGAWMHVNYTEDLLTLGGVTAITQVQSNNRTGFTVGVGIEFGLVENLSGKIEYDFYDFGSKNYNFPLITPVSVRSDLHTLTAGLNYRFNWSGGPKP